MFLVLPENPTLIAHWEIFFCESKSGKVEKFLKIKGF
jgi:hypothetical protein